MNSFVAQLGQTDRSDASTKAVKITFTGQFRIITFNVDVFRCLFTIKRSFSLENTYLIFENIVLILMQKTTTKT